MEIEKKIIAKLSPNDLKEIIIGYLKGKGVDIKTVHFGIRGYNEEGDWKGEYPPEHKLYEVVWDDISERREFNLFDPQGDEPEENNVETINYSEKIKNTINLFIIILARKPKSL